MTGVPVDTKKSGKTTDAADVAAAVDATAVAVAAVGAVVAAARTLTQWRLIYIDIFKKMSLICVSFAANVSS